MQNDNELYCGGFGVQHFQNNGRCGICGDPWHKNPKEHEAPGGLYANGIITKIYKQVHTYLNFMMQFSRLKDPLLVTPLFPLHLVQYKVLLYFNV